METQKLSKNDLSVLRRHTCDDIPTPFTRIGHSNSPTEGTIYEEIQA